MERQVVNPWTWQDQFGFVQANLVQGVQRTLVCSGQLAADADGNLLHAGDIGRASAVRFAAEGASIVIADVQDEAMSALAEELGRDVALAVRCDVTDEAQVEAAVGRAVERFGRLDVGMFCAGGGGGGPV